MALLKKIPDPNIESHQLTDEEWNYVANIFKSKQAIADEYNRVISAFLKYVTSSRLDYPAAQDLQFELDLSDGNRTLKVTRV